MEGVTNPNPRVDAFLAHYGVLGMKWGIRKEEPTSGKRHSGTKQLDPKTRKKAQDLKMASNMMRAKYGSPEASKKAVSEIERDTKKQFDYKKAALITLGIVGAVSVAAVAVDMARHPMKYQNLRDQLQYKLSNLKSNKSEADELANWASMFDEAAYDGVDADEFAKWAAHNRKYQAHLARFGNVDDYMKAISSDVYAEKMIRRFPGLEADVTDKIFRLADEGNAFFGKNYAYVNFRLNDNRRYQAIYKDTFGGVMANKITQFEFLPKQKIRIPSGDEMIDAYTKVMAELGDKAHPQRNQSMIPNIGTDSNGDFFKNLYIDVQGIIQHDSTDQRPVTAALIKELKKRGFQGMPDWGDYGRSTRSAAVIFDPEDALDTVSEVPLTEKMIYDAIEEVSPDPFID